jgi:hypothetical protein
VTRAVQALRQGDMRGRFATLAAIVAAAGVLVASSQALAATGPIQKTCGKAWEGNSQQSEACVMLWWDESTQRVSARCTVEYGFFGVATYVYWCELQQRKGKTTETLEAFFPGETDTSTANQVYTYSTPGVQPVLKDTYSANFASKPSLGSNSTGPEVQLATPFVHALPFITGIAPNSGSISGDTTMTITGAGFALGTTATVFKFGSTVSTSVNCTSSNECIVVAPAHKKGNVDVKATVNKVTSAKNRPADQFTYA